MIQVACVKWGTKYGAGYVNGMYQAVVKHTPHEVRFVCITDRLDDDYDEGIHVRPFPDFGVPLEAVNRCNCRGKLAIFFDGILQPGIETIFLDLDTMVCGDLGVLAQRLRDKPGLYMMRNHLVPYWRIASIVKRVLPRQYYFGNSSILAFYPEQFYFLAETLREKLQVGEPYFCKSLDSDERFISCYARGQVRVFNPKDAVKFVSEYMAPLPIVESVRRRLPWVAARRRSTVAVTFAGDEIKPQKVVKFKAGETIKVKNGYIRWQFDDYSQYWRSVESQAA